MASMLHDKQANEYSEHRPTYPASWFSMLASLTANHQLAWDVGAGNGQASISIAEHYDRVIATDISKNQLELAHKHPKVKYAVTPPVMMDEELFSIVGEEGSVDLVTVATAVHWFDLETFYSQVKRLLRKPGGVIAVWTYWGPTINPAVDAVCKDVWESTGPYWDPRTGYVAQGYRTLPFPFEAVLDNGRGSEGNPMEMEMEIQVSLEKLLGFFKSASAVVTAREKGVDILNEKVCTRLKEAWGDENMIYTATKDEYNGQSKLYQPNRVKGRRILPPVAASSQSLTYKDAGVDIDAGTELVKRIAKMAPGIGGFGGLFPFGDSFLVAGTDGVGTKLKLAFETGIHDTIGVDLVAMSVNDIITSGAKPLFFLDYFATSHLDVDLAEKVIKGIVDGCQQSDCALLGGETAEMPDFYAEGEYDLSGFAVGVVKKDAVIDGKTISVGDVLIGLPSSGVHSNGFSLVRRVLAQSGLSLKDALPGNENELVTLGAALMAPTVIYVKQVLDMVSKGGVKGVAHITGGGFTDNIPRIFPKGLGAVVNTKSWEVPSIFKWIQKSGRIEDSEMRRTFNMGIGMVIVASQEAANRILSEGNTKAYHIGHVVEGEGVIYE